MHAISKGMYNLLITKGKVFSTKKKQKEKNKNDLPVRRNAMEIEKLVFGMKISRLNEKKMLTI